MKLAAIVVLLLSAAAQAAPAPAGRPNIVFVLIDDAGFGDLGPYGSEIATPNIDQIAQAGVRLTNFHTASTCEATRVMLQSGVDNHRAGAGTLQVAMAESQKGRPGYEGHLSDQAHSLGQLLKDGGYSTYYAGKWNLGFGLERSPGARGWDRYISLELTGADNFEAKVYAPFNTEAIWWEDGRRATLPKDFYSSRTYVDKLIGYIDQGRSQGKPFMAMLALQAVHSPLQAPAADIAKYLGRYQAGWDSLRQQRYQRQVELGLMPAGLSLPQASARRPWESLSTAQRREFARKMAVFAAMLDNADQQIGRLREHLRRSGELDNTVFIVMSDNGADGFDLSQLNLPFRLWYRANFALGFEQMGGPGSYVHYGQDWAEVSNTPLAGFKGTSAGGGMRVPFIISHPSRLKPGGSSAAFAYATDFLPTILDIAGIAQPSDEYRGKKLHRPTGQSLMPHLEGRTPSVHGPDQAIGFESTGGQALIRGDYKLMRNGAPYSDNRWKLYRLSDDPTEARDLSNQEPALMKTLLAEVEAYNQRVGVVMPEPGYNPLRQVLVNNWPVLVQQLWPLLLVASLALASLVWLGLRLWRRSAAR
ncbi:MAG: arylsulfatase [Burkholderiaceae bacterium]|nr:arylsulfatase [Burkholderiaceae bacterium]